MQLHLQNRGTEQKPNIWFIPVPDLQIPKLILLSPTYVVLINFAQSSLIWTLEFWQPKPHFWKYVLPVTDNLVTS